MTLLFSGVAGVVLLISWFGQVAPSTSAPCYQTLALTPQTLPGAPWQEHRHRLVPASRDLPDGLSYLVWNRRTGHMYRWLHDTTTASAPRILVSTRYALLHNRDWDEDPWAYCLVLAPDPPFRDRNHGFTSWMRASTPLVERAGSVSITAMVVADGSGHVLVDIEVYDPSGVKVAQWVYPDQELRANRGATYTTTWQIPPDAQHGIYTIKLGVFTPGWSKLIHWNAGTAVVAVR
jgi:hypothetical protein